MLRVEITAPETPHLKSQASLRQVNIRPSSLDQLLVNRQGRNFILELFSSLKKQGYGRSDFLSLCLREIIANGHVSELLKVCPGDHILI